MIRRFYHREKFTDGTRFLEWKNGKMYFVDKNYKRKKARVYDLKIALDFVKNGDWIEKSQN